MKLLVSQTELDPDREVEFWSAISEFIEAFARNEIRKLRETADDPEKATSTTENGCQ